MKRYFLFLLISLSSLASLSYAAEGKRIDFSKFLPARAEVARVADPSAIGSDHVDDMLAAEKLPKREAVFLADLDKDGRDEVTVFYTLPSPDEERPWESRCNILVLKWDGRSYVRLWEQSEEGTKQFEPFSGMWDINKDGVLEAVAAMFVGANAGSEFKIFRADGRTFARIPFLSSEGKEEKFTVHTVGLADWDNDGVDEIIVPHVTLAHQSIYGLDDFYKWDGKAYRNSNELFAERYTSAIDYNLELLQDESLGVGYLDRLRWGYLALEGLLYQKRFEEAVEVTDKMIKIVEEAHMKGEIVSAEDLDRKLSILHTSKGDVFGKEGSLDKAAAEYKMAIELNPQNERAREKLEKVLESKRRGPRP